MKTKKYIFVVSLIITVISLGLAIMLYILSSEYLNLDFYIDISLGTFSGAFFSSLITIIEYFSCRKKNLETLFDLLCRQRYQFNQIEYYPEHTCTENLRTVLHERHINKPNRRTVNKKSIDNQAPDTLRGVNNCSLNTENGEEIDIDNDLIEFKIDNTLRQITSVIDSYEKVEYKTGEIGNVIADSSFLFNDKKIKSKLFEIYQFIRDIEEEYAVTAFHFNNYKTMSVSPLVVIDYIVKLQEKFFHVEIDENAIYHIIVYSEFAKKIDNMLDYIGYLCYGKKYNPCTMKDGEYLKCAFSNPHCNEEQNKM